ncbi:MAG TPA: hypothetical protein DIW54_00820 [Chitinophagaceae bacterium]|nr:hypothetical protein [Chitinophagaceae bacterium]HCT21945.1 hypothetical protein [Chitinophagaceae bacterium]
MYNGILHLHNLLRWIILILLIVNVVSLFGGKKNAKLSLYLMISAHLMLVIGLYQYIAGDLGLATIKVAGMGQTMKNSVARYWAVEHITGMLIAIILITLGHGRVKRDTNTKRAKLYFTLALLLILVMMPWPFREGIARSWFPGM